ncbi:MAG: hypothetical protein ACFB2Z_13785 [Maricaulaceae bacterium]
MVDTPNGLLEGLFTANFNDLSEGIATSSIIGTPGDDVFVTDGLEAVDGGEGIDTLDVSGAAEGVLIDLDINDQGNVAPGEATQIGAITLGGVTNDVIDIENIIGTDFNDTLFGNDEANEIIAGDGDDVIHPFGGVDFIDGGAGVDSIIFPGAFGPVLVNIALGTAGPNTFINIENAVGGAFDDTLIGDDGDNVLTGNGGADTLTGAGGDDTFVSDGLDAVDGGEGSDTVDFSGLSEGIIVDLDLNTPPAGGESQDGAILDAPPAAGGVPVNGVNLIDIENVIGTAFDDVLFGNNEVNVLDGGAGDDVFHSFGGADFVNGGDGIDTVLFTAGGGVTVDLDDDGNAVASVGDTLTGIENIQGSGADANDISGNSGANVLTGGASNDILDGEGGADTLIGLAGDDLLVSDGLDDIDGGEGDDTASFAGSEVGVIASLEEDVVAEVTVLNDGSVDLSGLGAAPTAFTLEAGVSRIVNQVANAAAVPDFPDQDVDIFTITIPEGFELSSVILSQFVSTDDVGFFAIVEGDTFPADALAADFDPAGLLGLANFGNGGEFDALTGTNVLPALAAGGGLVPADAFIGFDGEALGPGAFTFLVQQLGPAPADFALDFTVIPSDGSESDAFSDLIDVENLSGSDASDVLIGDDGDNIISGEGGNDVLVGGAGDDTFLSDGQDDIDGGEGNDTLDFSGLGADEAPGPFDGVIVDLDINSAGPAGTPSEFGGVLSAPPAAGGTILFGVDDIENVIGSDFNDGLFGNNEVNVLEGGAGDDLVHGFAGDDFQSGGAGTDTVLFAAAQASVFVDLNDQVSEEEFEAIVDGDADAVFAATGGAGNNVLSGFENVAGGAADDTLIGDGGDNVLDGNGGEDTLTGGAGDDTLVSDGLDTLDGGEGVDTADFADAAEGVVASLVDGAVSVGGEPVTDPVASPPVNDGVVVLNDGSTDLPEFGEASAVFELGVGSSTLTNTVINAAGLDTLPPIDIDVFTVVIPEGAVLQEVILTGFESVDDVGFAAVQEGGEFTVDLNSPPVDTSLLLGGALFGNGAPGSALTGTNILPAFGAGGNSLPPGSFIGFDGELGLPAGEFTFLFQQIGGAIIEFELEFVVVATDAVEVPAATGTFTGIENLSGSAFDDTLIGDEGDNVLDGGAGADTLTGAGGDDTFVSDGLDTIDGGEGFDTVDFSGLAEGEAPGPFTGVIVDLDVNTPPAGAESQDGGVLDAPPAAGGSIVGTSTLTDIEGVIGSDFDDGLFGNNETNVLDGGAGDDIVHSFGGPVDFASGGAGNDTILFAAAPVGVTVDLGAQLDEAAFDAAVEAFLATGETEFTGEILSEFENVTGGAFDDTITGDENANILNGGGGADTLTGAGGDDTFITDGLDQIDGGEGSDTVDFSGLSEGIIVDLDVDSAGPTGTPGQDGAILDAPPAAGGVPVNGVNLIDIENVIGTAFDDGLFGNNEVNVLEGGDGDDVIHGFAGDDFQSGGAGIDTVVFAAAGAGIQVDLRDQVSEEEFAAAVAGEASFEATTSGGAGENLLSGFENVTGPNFDDVIFGDGAVNVLNGLAGDDVFHTFAGADTVNGGEGSDTILFTAAPVGVVIDLDDNGDATSSFGDVLTSIENVSGSDSGDDEISGNAGDNVLDGQGGSDVLNGEGGFDTFISDGFDTIDGGTGFDTVDFSGLGAGVDVDLTAGTVSATAITVLNDGSTDLSGDGSAPTTFVLGEGISRVTNQVANAAAVPEFPTQDVDIITITIPEGFQLESLVLSDFISTDDVGFLAVVEGDTFPADALAADFDPAGLLGLANFGDGVPGDALTGTDILPALGAGGALLPADAFIGFDGEALGPGTFAFLIQQLGPATIDYTLDFVVEAIDPVDTAATGSLASIEEVIGSDFGDTINGSAANDFVKSGDGADLVFGLAGNDTIQGEDGFDFLFGGAGDDVILGGNGVDQIGGCLVDDTLIGGEVSDFITGGFGYDTIEGGLKFDFLFGGAGDDLIIGGVGQDTIGGGAGADTIQATLAEANGDIILNFDGLDTLLITDGAGADVAFDAALGELVITSGETTAVLDFGLAEGAPTDIVTEIIDGALAISLGDASAPALVAAAEPATEGVLIADLAPVSGGPIVDVLFDDPSLGALI